MKQSIFLLLILISAFSYSQNIEKEQKNFDWRMISSGSNQQMGVVNTFLSSWGDLATSKIYLTPKEAVTLVAYRRNSFGIMKISSDMKVLWNTALKGTPMKMARFHGNLIVITDDGDNDAVALQLWANIVDATTGKVIKRKKLYDMQGKYAEEAKFFVSPNGELTSFGIRQSARENKSGVAIAPFGFGIGKAVNQFLETRSFSLLDINEHLETSVSELDTKLTGEFITCETDSEGNIFISTRSNSVYIISMFDKRGKKRMQMACPFDARANSSFSSVLQVSSRPGILYLAATYTNEEKNRAFGIFCLNFKENTKKFQRVVFDKQYRKELKDGHKPVNSKLDKLHTENWDDLEVIRIAEHNGNIIAWNECVSVISRTYGAGSSMSSRDKWLNTDAMMMIFSEKLEKPVVEIIPKKMELEKRLGFYSSFHIRGDELYFVSSHLRPMLFTSLTGKYDLSAKKMISLNQVEKQAIPNLNMADPNASLWFDDGVIVPYMDPKGLIKVTAISTDLQKLSYW